MAGAAMQEVPDPGEEIHDIIFEGLSEFKIDGQARRQLEETASKAASRVRIDSVDAARGLEARENARFLVDEIVKILRDSERDTVQVRDVEAAFLSLCPLYPFC